MPADDADMTVGDANLALVARLTDLIEVEHDIDGLDGVLAEDFVNHSPSEGFAADREGFKATARSVYGAFSDLESTIEEAFAAGDRVVTRWTERGTHSGEYLGVVATGRAVVVRAIEIWRVRDGLIVERWAEVNEVELLRQIGALT